MAVGTRATTKAMGAYVSSAWLPEPTRNRYRAERKTMSEKKQSKMNLDAFMAKLSKAKGTLTMTVRKIINGVAKFSVTDAQFKAVARARSDSKSEAELETADALSSKVVLVPADGCWANDVTFDNMMEARVHHAAKNPTSALSSVTSWAVPVQANKRMRHRYEKRALA